MFPVAFCTGWNGGRYLTFLLARNERCWEILCYTLKFNSLLGPISPRRVMRLISSLVSATRSTFTLPPVHPTRVLFYTTCKFSQIFLVLMPAENLSRNFLRVHQIWITTLAASLVKKPLVLICKTHIYQKLLPQFFMLCSACWYVLRYLARVF